MNFGIEFQTPVYNIAYRVSPWLKASYAAAFFALVPLYGIPASVAAAALALWGIRDMRESRRLAWGMAAVPLAVAAVTLVSDVAVWFGSGALSNITLGVDEHFGHRPQKVWGVVLGLAGFLLSVVIHEPAHAMMAYWFGDTTAADQGRLTFTPHHHINPLTTVLMPAVCLLAGLPVFGWASTPVNPSRMRPQRWGDFSTSIAGPLSNLLMAGAAIHLMLVTLLLSGFTGTFDGLLDTLMLPSEPLTPALAIAYFFKLFAVMNLWLFFLNALPIPGIDGGNALLVMLPGDLSFKLRRHGIFLLFIAMALMNSQPFNGWFFQAVDGLTKGAFQGLGFFAGVHVRD